MTALEFIVALAIIVIASELFTNAVEWLGFHLHLGAGATGSLLAAFGTALPETTVPIVALIANAPSATAVATGAVLGAPFLLLTLGVSITGIAVALRRDDRHLELRSQQARRDLGTFVFAFTLVIVAMALPQAGRIAVGCILLLAYVAYVVATLRDSTPSSEKPDPLHTTRWRSEEKAPLWAVVFQLLVAVGGLIIGSKLFVDALGSTATALHISPLVLALVLVPFATELPETLNSVLWVRTRDDGLAFGNVAGSATFQACLLGFLGVVFTPWRPGGAGLLSACLTLATAVLLLALLRNGRARGVHLMLAALPWLAYVVVALASGGHIGAAAG